MKHIYKTKGTCSTHILVDVEKGKVNEVEFVGGCNGNLQGICKLVEGMTTQDVCERLEGIHCGKRDTSCPDQLCKAIEEALSLESTK